MTDYLNLFKKAYQDDKLGDGSVLEMMYMMDAQDKSERWALPSTATPPPLTT